MLGVSLALERLYMPAPRVRIIGHPGRFGLAPGRRPCPLPNAHFGCSNATNAIRSHHVAHKSAGYKVLAGTNFAIFFEAPIFHYFCAVASGAKTAKTAHEVYI